MTKFRWWFGVITIYNVPKINKKSELIDMNQKIPFLKNLMKKEGAKIKG